MHLPTWEKSVFDNLYMKFTILTAGILIGVLTAAAQEKPTMEQTAKYIVDNYPRQITCMAGKKNSRGEAPFSVWADEKVEIRSVEFGGSVLKLSYRDVITKDFSAPQSRNVPKPIFKTDTLKNENCTVAIDMSQIQKVEVAFRGFYGGVSSRDANDHGTFLAFLRFATNGEKSIRSTVNGKVTMLAAVDVPFGNYVVRTEGNAERLTGTQLFKAISHLRKLCGGPEPLSFD